MLLKDKKCLIFGVANNRSIAYGIASCFKEQGARLAFSYAGEAIHKRVEPISEELGGEFIFPCDVTSDEDIAAAAALVKEKWGSVDVLVHSVAFANREDLTKRFIETSRDGFATALNVSAYSLTALCHAFEPMLNPGASVLTMTYYGAQKIITNYNVMPKRPLKLRSATFPSISARRTCASTPSAPAPSRRWLPLAFPTSSRSSITLKNTPPSAAT